MKSFEMFSISKSYYNEIGGALEQWRREVAINICSS
jgi:hypothetical protein